MKNMVSWLIYLLIISLALGQLSRLSYWGSQVNFYIHDIITGLAILFYLGLKLFKKQEIYFPKLFKPILGFACLAFFSWVLGVPFFQSRELLVALLYLLRWLAYATLFLIIHDLKKSGIKLEKGQSLLLISGLVAALLGLLQYLFFPDIRPLTVLNWDPHYFRVVGSFLDPGFSGLFYVLTLILILFVLRPGWSQKLWFFVVYLALALTYSRSAYLSYIFSMLIIAKFKKSLKFFLLALFFGVLTVIILPRPGGEGVRLERQSTIWARLENWQQAITISLNRPLFGTGFNTWRYVQKNLGILDEDSWQWSHSGAGVDNSWLFVLATCGMAGFLAYVFLLSKIQVDAKNNPIIQASLGAIVIHSMFNNSLFYAWIMLWLWLILGLFKENS